MRKQYIRMLVMCYITELLSILIICTIISIPDPVESTKRRHIEAIPEEIEVIDIPLPYTIAQYETDHPELFVKKEDKEESKYDLNEIIMVAMVVHDEAGNQDMHGKRLVASVVYNRVESMMFPDTVIDVITQDNQFAVGTRYTSDDLEAAKVEANDRTDENILYFRKDKYHKIGNPAYKYGDHYFSTR